MSTNHTEHFNLCQWEANDKVLRSDFNADNQKIDAALKANADAIALKADSSALSALSASTQSALAGKADLSAVPKIATGTYTGNGAAVTVEVGFQPSFLVILAPHPGRAYTDDQLLALGTAQCMIADTRSNGPERITTCAFTAAGFTITDDDNTGLNNNGDTNHYIAFR